MALYNYYKTSKGRVKVDNQISKEFKIQEGVNQGGILSPYLFNYFMKKLLNENDLNRYGATIDRFNVGLISYCDDLDVKFMQKIIIPKTNQKEFTYEEHLRNAK